MKTINRWGCDTCDCIIDFEFDDQTQAFSYKQTIKACPIHAALNGKPEHFYTLLEENQRKNFTFAEITKLVPQAKAEDYSWSFDKDRILQVTLAGINAGQKTGLQTAVNTRFGNGKVKVI